MKRKGMLAALAAVLLCAAGASADEETIRIGVYNCLTGASAVAGQLEVEGVKLAHAEMPEVLGRKVELVVVDNRSNLADAADAVARLIEKEKVAAILGTFGSSLAMAGGGVAEQARIPVVGGTCTSPLVTEGKKYYFRACFDDIRQAEGAARYIFRNLGHMKAALLIDTALDYSVGQANYFRRSFTDLGGTIVGEIKYRSDDRDFSEQIAAIAELDPEVVYLPAYFEEGAVLLGQARAAGLTCAFFGSDSMDTPELTALDKNVVEGFRFTTAAYDPTMPDMNAMARRFTGAWLRAHPDTPPNSIPALGYDSYFLLMAAIEKAGRAEPEAIRDALETIRNLPSVTGMTTVDANHDVDKDIGVVKITDGRRIFIGTISPGS